MSSEDLEKYEAEMELQLYREYRDVVGLFSYVVETERRFYLTNHVDLQPRSAENGEMYFEVTMRDAWVWDMYRPARFVKNVRVVTFKDVNIEEITKTDLEIPGTELAFAVAPLSRETVDMTAVVRPPGQAARTHHLGIAPMMGRPPHQVGNGDTP